jgi:hypothetical protein
MRPKDEELLKQLQADGLIVEDWVTVPDPWEQEWPFALRYPGQRCPPDPSMQLHLTNDATNTFANN